MRRLERIAFTPAATFDPAIAIAASRAGAVGMLDLEHARSERDALAAVRRLARYGGRECGVKLDGGSQLAAAITAALPESVRWILLTATDSDELRAHVARVRRRGAVLLLEATTAEAAALGEELEVDGLVAKGHEAGGRVGEETTFVLLQRLLARRTLPVWAHGGIGLHSAAACLAAGAAGVALDAQLALTRESSLPGPVRAAIARMDGSETVALGGELGARFRVYQRPGLSGVQSLQRLERELADGADADGADAAVARWGAALRERVGWADDSDTVWPLGQDAAFAAGLARRFGTVAGVLEGMRSAAEEQVRAACAARPLAEGAPLARSHGTRYPIVQGPMTRVSDVAAFAERVAAGGALPCLALALMRAPEVATLLSETRERLGSRPWGVGILGFVPPELRREQMAVIREHPPTYAVIAGGQPEHARDLERDGIPTYLHVPSAALLRLFLDAGARRFVFEGRECGGHVGPRSSFVLWDQIVSVLLSTLRSQDDWQAC
jgi:NAD(P)H-dependent flavin oxidoreductase YrpB (nitropropane dioxygenase family)